MTDKTRAGLVDSIEMESHSHVSIHHLSVRADAEGHPEIATLLRAISKGDFGHAMGSMDYMPTYDFKTTFVKLIEFKSQAAKVYNECAELARSEGDKAEAAWFTTLATSEAAHAIRLMTALGTLA